MLLAGLAALLVIGMIGGYFAFKPAAAPKMVELAKTISTPAGDMVLVPAGEFRFGQFKQVASLPAFYIDKTEVSNAAYARFCKATNRPLPEDFPDKQPSYPVVNVTIRDAREFARWAGKRLPTALEWEKAARGTDGRIFPWGNEKDASRANTKTGDATPELKPVDSFPSGASPYGALNMVGNALELVDTPRTAPTDKDLLKAMKSEARRSLVHDPGPVRLGDPGGRCDLGFDRRPRALEGWECGISLRERCEVKHGARPRR